MQLGLGVEMHSVKLLHVHSQLFNSYETCISHVYPTFQNVSLTQLKYIQLFKTQTVYPPILDMYHTHIQLLKIHVIIPSH